MWLCSHTGCMARSRTAAMAEKARRAPQTHGWWTALTRKKSSKTFKVWGFLSDLVRYRRICAVRFSIHASHCCGERAKGPSAPPGGGTWGTGSPECAGHRHPHTARRHTQVPPYIPRRTADMVRRAGPMCPAAGMHRKPHNRLARSDRVGRGLAPAAGIHHRFSTGPRPKRRGLLSFFLSFCYCFLFLFIYYY